VSGREVIEAHLRGIEAVNPLINAVTVVLGEQALDAAKAADRAAAGGGELPPFHGVPFTVKENIDLAGTDCVGLPCRAALIRLGSSVPGRWKSRRAGPRSESQIRSWCRLGKDRGFA
jgi:amidase